MRRAFTMIEVIVVIVIMGILSAGTLISVKHLYIRATKTKIITDFSADSEIVLNQISSLLYERVPSSTIGYDSSSGNFQSIYDINDSFSILEWIGVASESYIQRDYSGFIDMDKSDKNTNTIVSFDISKSELDNTLRQKFGGELNVSKSDIALIFAGSFDSGGIISANDFNGSFGWHGNSHDVTYDINISESNITFGAIRPKEIYEKYYLVDSAYAVARGADINISTCSGYISTNDDTNDTLYLFYNYRPWKKETFCADPKTNGTRDGNVTILAKNVTAFKTGLMNDSIYFDITFNKKIRGSDNNVTISKQKVVF